MRAVSKALQVPVVTVIGHLHCLWHKVLEFHEDGDISTWDINDLAYYARWDGDPQKFYDALKERFIDEKNGYKLVHDWLDYAYRYLHSKYRNTNPKYLRRIEKKHSWKGLPIGRPSGLPKDGPPNLTVPNIKEAKSRAKLDFNYLKKSNINNLFKAFGDKESVKRHLMSMGFYETRVIEAFEKAGVR